MTARIDAVLQAAVAATAVPGVVATAAGPDGVIYEGAAGRRSAATDDPITPDTMMRIASMTKMVTTTAALQLVERGSLSLDAPVRDYRPEFASLQVLTGFDGDTPQLLRGRPVRLPLSHVFVLLRAVIDHLLRVRWRSHVAGSMGRACAAGRPPRVIDAF